jgi:tRNA/tmRNA/rRNA uracil-C5-methylase (TrmA/RlmC/RlmD family)
MCPGRPEAHSEEFVELAIERIGARGDGVAQYRGEPVFVLFMVPAIASALGSGRAAPRCRRFGTGGGCALQHLDDASYRRVKWRHCIPPSNASSGHSPRSTSSWRNRSREPTLAGRTRIAGPGEPDARPPPFRRHEPQLPDDVGINPDSR